MDDKELYELAKEAAQELSYEWKIGNEFTEETDDGGASDTMFDYASVDEIAQRLLPFFRKVLTSPKSPATVGLT